MPSKIALGTVQFGLNYGINNKSGQIPEHEIAKILTLAYGSEIAILDTAYVYGDSESRIGQWLHKMTTHTFEVVSKMPKCNKEEIVGYFEQTLERLQVESIYGYLYHNYDMFVKDRSTLDVLIALKEKKLVKKIGFSLYYPSELEEILDKNIQCDLLQMPYSILDRRFEPYFEKLQKRGIEIHTRSIYLQGLVFKSIHELSPTLLPFEPFLNKLQDLALQKNLGVDEIALNFGLKNRYIDKIIIGVDNAEQLLQLVNIEKRDYGTDLFLKSVDLFLGMDIFEALLIPSNWN